MATHTFCRAKNFAPKPCTAADALAIVNDILSNGSRSLADDLRVNLHKVSMELEVLKEFPDELEAAGRREPAATTPGAAAKTPGAASTGKKERKHDKKHKDAKENAQPLTEGKKDKEKAGGSGKGDKTEGAAREGKEGKKRRDGKKGKEGKDGEGKAAKEGKEAKDATRKRPAEETVDGGKDTVQKPKRRKVEA